VSRLHALHVPSGACRHLLSVATAAALLVSAGLPSAVIAVASNAATPASGSVGPAAAARSYPATIADARAAVADLMKDPALSSISIALVDGSRIAWQESFGYADRSTGAKPTATTMYGIGSVSKVFATMAVMTLVDAGKVSLDAPVVRYIQDFTMASPDYRRITVRMLLDHSAGLPGTDYRNWSMTRPIPEYADQVLETLRTERTKTTPGSMSVYCNDCFTLAQILVARVSGMSYPEYVSSAILTPLGMTHSRYPTAPFDPGTAARVYDPGTRTTLPQEYVGPLGSGGLFSTPSDMAHVATMLMDGGVYAGRRVLSATSVAEMGRDQAKGSLDPTVMNAFVYGLGWDTVREPGLAKVGV
jgi:CubicO group peptidase (beta-lactamase class C family)